MPGFIGVRKEEKRDRRQEVEQGRKKWRKEEKKERGSESISAASEHTEPQPVCAK